MVRLDLSRAGHDLAVAQLGSDAVVADRTVGDIVGVDGATLSRNGPVTPFGPAAASITLFSALSAVYAVDADHGTVVALDPRTLEQRSDLVPLAAGLSPDNTIVDAAGGLWGLDEKTGDVQSVRQGTKQPPLHFAGDSSSLLVDVHGRPVVVGLDDRTARVLDPATGAVVQTQNLDLQRGDAVTVGGSRSDDTLLTASAARRILLLTDLGSGQSQAVQLPPGVGQLGRPVELGHRAFVPDLAKGSVYVVDLESRRFLATVVLPGGAAPKLQLIPQDDRVFYNDPSSDRAGVIRLDASTTGISKYDPANPKSGLTATPQVTPSPAAGSTPSTQTPAPGQTTAPGPPPTAPAGPPSPSPKGSGTPTSTPRAAVTANIIVSSRSVDVGVPVTLSVELSDGSPPSRVEWGFGDAASAVGTQLSHSWSAPGVYQVTARATGAAPVTTTITVTPPPKPTASPTSSTPGGNLTAGLTISPGGPVLRCKPATLTPTASGGTGALSAQVDFGDGTKAPGAIGSATSHVYPAPGSYDASVTVTDDGGKTATSIPQTVVVSLPQTPMSTTASINADVLKLGSPLTITPHIGGGSGCPRPSPSGSVMAAGCRRTVCRRSATRTPPWDTSIPTSRAPTRTGAGTLTPGTSSSSARRT